MEYSKEAILIRDAQLRQGFNIGDRFGMLEISANVVREAVREAVDVERAKFRELMDAVLVSRPTWIQSGAAPEILIALHKLNGEPEHQCETIAEDTAWAFCRVCGMRVLQ